MVYVLIMILSSGGNNTAAVHMQEFTSKEKCEIALNRIYDSKLIDNRWKFVDYYHKSLLLCVEK